MKIKSVPCHVSTAGENKDHASKKQKTVKGLDQTLPHDLKTNSLKCETTHFCCLHGPAWSTVLWLPSEVGHITSLQAKKEKIPEQVPLVWGVSRSGLL